jgi:putative flippase GtrA
MKLSAILMQKIKLIIGQHRLFLLYALIGGSGVLLDLLAFLVLFNTLHLDENIATILSTSLGITNNFLWNAFFNFKTADKIMQRFAKFYGVGVSGIILTILLFAIFVDLFKVDANIVKVGSLFPVLLMQYWLNKKWTFS